MKRGTGTRFALRVFVCCMLLMGTGTQALAFDAKTADSWMTQFAAALQSLTPLNDPAQTADPARAGQMLLEYEFGTVLSSSGEGPSAEEILEIDVRTSQVTDCRGVRVGMGVDAALDGKMPGAAGTQLYVLETQEAGYGWSWAYVNDGGVYGVEYITYAGDEASMTEYTLTYVIDGGVITAIRLKAANATLAQAQEGFETAEEIASRQDGELFAERNDQPAFAANDLQVQGGDALGVPVAQLISLMGEPQNVQTLPKSQGRILVYDGAVVRLALNEATGEEIVRGISASSETIVGPRRLTVGMGVQEAAALFSCEADVSSRGGTLYLAGEAEGEPPYGELTAVNAGGMLLRYACVADDGETALLEAGIEDGVVAYWSLSYPSDTEGGI